MAPTTTTTAAAGAAFAAAGTACALIGRGAGGGPVVVADLNGRHSAVQCNCSYITSPVFLQSVPWVNRACRWICAASSREHLRCLLSDFVPQSAFIAASK